MTPLIKASILITNYNKEKELPNTLFSISRQKTSFAFEVCFLDDCSYIDPYPLYTLFLRTRFRKGVRLHHHLGTRGGPVTMNYHKSFLNAWQETYKMTDPSSELIILQSADVFWSSPDMLEKMLQAFAAQPFAFHVPIVKAYENVNGTVTPPDLFIDFDSRVSSLLASPSGEYQGPSREMVEPFLLPVLRSTLEEIAYAENTGLGNVWAYHKLHGRSPSYMPDVVGIHQNHGSVRSASITCDDNLVNWDPDVPVERTIYA